MAVNIKKILSDSLWALSKERSIKDIRLYDVLDRSGVCKQTFYSYFKNLDALMAYTISDRFTAYSPTLPNADLYYDSAVFFYSAALENKSFITQIYRAEKDGSAPDIRLQCYSDYFKSLICPNCNVRYAPQVQFAIEYNAQEIGMINKEWIMGGMKESPEQIAKICKECLPAAMRDYMEAPSLFKQSYLR